MIDDAKTTASSPIASRLSVIEFNIGNRVPSFIGKNEAIAAIIQLLDLGIFKGEVSEIHTYLNTRVAHYNRPIAGALWRS